VRVNKEQKRSIPPSCLKNTEDEARLCHPWFVLSDEETISVSSYYLGGI